MKYWEGATRIKWCNTSFVLLRAPTLNPCCLVSDKVAFSLYSNKRKGALLPSEIDVSLISLLLCNTLYVLPPSLRPLFSLNWQFLHFVFISLRIRHFLRHLKSLLLSLAVRKQFWFQATRIKCWEQYRLSVGSNTD